MPLTPDEAAKIAKGAGLGIGEAVALRALADDVETAERIASTFAVSDERTFVRDLFGTAERIDASDVIGGIPGVTSTEGGNPAVGPDLSDPAVVARRLFHPEEYP